MTIPYTPSSSQIDLFLDNAQWFQTNVVADSSTGKVGMFGDETSDRYFLFMNFEPHVDITQIDDDYTMYLWCQSGNASSEWQGVRFVTSSFAADGVFSNVDWTTHDS